jgi:enamine deaminase RidA (YjgF/YER057c/UK114 family)
MQRTAINPWPWSLNFGYNQGELIEGQRRILVCAGQTATDGIGTPQHAGDMAAQVGMALDNLEAVLAGAGMTLSNIIKLNFYTTDMDAFSRRTASSRGALVSRGSRRRVPCSGSLASRSRS